MDECLDLPPGFRFHPTDEEIITHYLSPKFLTPSFSARAMGEVDLKKCEPWDLPSKAKMGEKEWYFFCQRDRKYPTGTRTNRATESGYWKATGRDKEIFRGKGILVGAKKTLVFYTGRAPKGVRSNWVMHEYRLEGEFPFSANLSKPAKDEWVVSRVFHKSNGAIKSPMMPDLASMNSIGDLLDSPNLPPLMDSIPFFNNDGNGGDDNMNNFDFKEIPSNPTAPMPSSYFSNVMGFDDASTNFSNANNYIGTSSLYNLNPYFFSHLGRCKAEQFPNHSMVSDDTGLSTDRNTEISSFLSRRDLDDSDVPVGAPGPALDLDDMWNC